MVDPVAEKSGLLKTYMSNHPDTLICYVKHFGRVKDTMLVSAEMSEISAKEMTLTYTRKDKTTGVVRVPFDPPLAGYEEVKPRLLGMKAEAQESLGMIRTPVITKFYPPHGPRFIGVFALMATLVYTTVAVSSSSFRSSPLFEPGRQLLAAVGGNQALKYFWQFIVVTHTANALYTLRLCIRHKTPLLVGAQYVLGALAFGFTVWTELRRRIQDARIESVMKVE